MNHDQLESVSEVPLAGATGRKFRVLVKVRGEEGWTGNQLVFDTEAEATAYGADLYRRWTAVEKFRVVEVKS